MSPRNDEKTAKDLGAEIRKRRVARGWTLRQLAAEAELDFGYVGKIERGEVAPVETYFRLVHALGLRLVIEIVENGRRSTQREVAASFVRRA